MSLVFAAMTPHPPILIPAIGKEQIAALAKTASAMERLEQELYVSKPQVIMIISPHGSLFGNAFAVNAHTNFTTLFEEFGDLATKKTWNGAPELAARISSAAKKRDLPVQLVSADRLDHGASVPLFYLTNHLPDMKILPMGYSGLSVDRHIQYGELLKDVIMAEDRRIAVIASGDLSHTPASASFDKELIELLEVRNTAGILQLGDDRAASAAECGYRSLLIALGILKNMNCVFKTYSYEAPFGVGYLVGNFVL
jgi:AmmeMemoRadiSam system protein B